MPQRLVGMAADRLGEQGAGGGAVVGLVQQDAEVDQGIEVGGVSLKDLEVTLTGLIRAPQRRQQAGRFGEQVKIAVAGRQARLGGVQRRL